MDQLLTGDCVMRRGGRALLRFLGWLMLVVGVLLIAWGFVIWKWGDPVTGLYTHWEQRKLADEYEQIVERYVPPPVTPSIPPAERRRRLHKAAVAFRKHSDAGQPIGRIRVKRLGLNMVLLNGTQASTLETGPWT